MIRPSIALRLPSLRRQRADASAGAEPAALHLPVDPRAALSGPLDPALERIRAGLRPHRRRLWMRRIVRRAWIVLAGIALLELALFTVARFTPIEAAQAIGVAIPVLGLAVLAVAAIRARPTLGEAAIAVDREAGLGDRVASALALAVAIPAARRRTRRSRRSRRTPRRPTRRPRNAGSCASSGPTPWARSGSSDPTSSDPGSRGAPRPWPSWRCSCSGP
jgi:hypothetical protein